MKVSACRLATQLTAIRVRPGGSGELTADLQTLSAMLPPYTKYLILCSLHHVGKTYPHFGNDTFTFGDKNYLNVN